MENRGERLDMLSFICTRLNEAGLQVCAGRPISVQEQEVIPLIVAKSVHDRGGIKVLRSICIILPLQNSWFIQWGSKGTQWPPDYLEETIDNPNAVITLILHFYANETANYDDEIILPGGIYNVW